MALVIHDTCAVVDPFWTLESAAYPADFLIADAGKYRVNGTMYGSDGYPENASRTLLYGAEIPLMLSVEMEITANLKTEVPNGPYDVQTVSLRYGNSLQKSVSISIDNDAEQNARFTLRWDNGIELYNNVLQSEIPPAYPYEQNVSRVVKLLQVGANMELYVGGLLVDTAVDTFGTKAGFLVQKNWEPDGGTDCAVAGQVDEIWVYNTEPDPPAGQNPGITRFF